jgi:mono/diheme cytochrome c family protein
MKYLKLGTAAFGAVMTVALFAVEMPAQASSDMDEMPGMVSTGLVMPEMDSANGRALFASKGCVVCHSINGVGGFDAPMLDAEFMDQPMNPFDFAANMWRGAETMVQMQREELGDVIQISGQDLADIIAFVHDPAEQLLFSEEDIPEDIEALMAHAESESEDEEHD